MSNIYARSFIFSNKQMQDRIDIETSKGGKKPSFGTVIVKGVPKIFTEILTVGSKSRYADARTLITGDIRSIRYNDPNNM